MAMGESECPWIPCYYMRYRRNANGRIECIVATCHDSLNVSISPGLGGGGFNKWGWISVGELDFVVVLGNFKGL